MTDDSHERRWLGLRVEAEGTGISRELSEQINLLGLILGQVIREEAGEEVFALVEELRQLCKRSATEGVPEPRERAAALIEGLELDRLVWLLRAYTSFFHLANQAEQHEIVRINRKRTRAGGDAGRPESIEEALRELRQRGMDGERLGTLLGRLEIEPTLTAHPTEARRRSILHKQREIARILSQLRSGATPGEEAESLDELFAQISLLFATDEVRAEHPTVADEVEQGLYFLQDTIWEMVPRIHGDMTQGIRRHFGGEAPFSPFVRYRSWIGADRDGNPRVTAEVTRRTLATHRAVAVRKQLEELRELRRELSISSRRAVVPDELQQSLEADRAEVEIPEYRFRQYRYEPYRLKLSFMMQRVEGLLGEGTTGSGSGVGYDRARFVADLDLIDRCLRTSGFSEAADNGRLARVRVLASSFGFHLAALDLRQHSEVHEEAVAELLRIARVEAEYASLPEADRVELLAAELANPRPLLPRGAVLPDGVREVLATFEVAAEGLSQEPASIGSYIVSMTHAASDLLEPLLLAKEVGLWTWESGAPLDFVPLFETIQDLDAADERMRELFAHPVYRRQVRARGDFQEIMLGYSDSNKDGGYWMANWALHVAQERLGRTCRDAGVDFRLFHGRGGSIGRGGGRAGQAILAMPPEARNGRIRLTEQGEVISFRYGLADIAHRHVEQLVNAMLLAELPRDDASATAHALMARIAARSMRAYREFIDAPDFWRWYTAVTPIEQISGLPIASRPVSRKTGSEVDFESLRAIPWVFAWTQVRYLVPGWYGVGTALQEVMAAGSEAVADLQALYRDWPFFRAVIENAEREMARARLDIAERYARFADDDGRGREMHERVTREFDRTREAILAVTGQAELLAKNPVIRKSIALRNPYTDVLNLLQIELMRRARAADGAPDPALRAPLFLSVNGLAAAMQSTG